MQPARIELWLAAIFALLAIGFVLLAFSANTMGTLFGGTLGALIAGIVALGFVMDVVSQQSDY